MPLWVKCTLDQLSTSNARDAPKGYMSLCVDAASVALQNRRLGGGAYEFVANQFAQATGIQGFAVFSLVRNHGIYPARMTIFLA